MAGLKVNRSKAVNFKSVLPLLCFFDSLNTLCVDH